MPAWGGWSSPAAGMRVREGLAKEAECVLVGKEKSDYAPDPLPPHSVEIPPLLLQVRVGDISGHVSGKCLSPELCAEW